MVRRDQQKRRGGSSRGYTEGKPGDRAPGSPRNRFKKEGWLGSKAADRTSEKENQELTAEFSNEEVMVTLTRIVLME